MNSAGASTKKTFRNAPIELAARTARLIVLAAGFGAAWSFGLWLIVVTMAAGAAALLVSERVGEHRLAWRAAAWALSVPASTAKPEQYEDIVAADIAAVASGDHDLLVETANQATITIADPWLRALAAERLEMAQRLGAQWHARVPRSLTLLARRSALAATAAATAAVAVAAAVVRHLALLVPLALAMTLAAIASVENRRRQRLTGQLCVEASALPHRDVILLPEPAVVGAILSLTASRGRALAKAVDIVTATPGPERDTALARLDLALHSAPSQSPCTLSRAVFWLAFVAATAVVVLEVL